MPTTAQTLHGDGTDWTASVRAIGTRTDNAGVDVDDLGPDEDRLINHVLTEGFLTVDAFLVQDGATGMEVDVGSGTANTDIYVVEGDVAGQHPYLVRMDDTQVTVTLDAGDADPRIDEIWLVVRENVYDASGLGIGQLVYRKGDAAADPDPPGPDASWEAAVLLATIDVAASASTIGAGDITDNRASSALNAVLEAALDHGSIAGLADFTADHGTEHDSHDHSAAASTIASADLADHNKTVHDALNIDADTLDGRDDHWHPDNDGPGSGLNADLLDGLQRAGFAEVAGDTFTGPVTVDDGISTGIAEDTHGPSAGPTAWPSGLSWQTVTSASGTWPGDDVGTVVTFNAGASVKTWQLFTDASNPARAYVRRWSTAASNWLSWSEFTTAENPGRWEVDESTEVATSTLGITYTDVAVVTLTIPSDWGSWKCEAWAHAVIAETNIYSFRISIDGTDSQAMQGIDTNGDKPVAVGGRRTGIVSTGGRSVSLQAKIEAGSGSLDDIYLYARAVRTS